MIVLILVALFGEISSFNLDTKSPYIVKSDAESGYFGYSVALHKNDEGNFLLIGAPTTATPQQGVKQGGGVFKCKVPKSMGDPTEPVVCSEQLQVLDDTGNKFVHSGDINGYFDFSYNKTDLYNMQSDEKSHQWLGVTLQSSIDSDYLVGCAHRYETKYLGIQSFWDDPPRQLTGKCVLLGKDLEYQESTYEPCRGVESGLTKVGNCQAGSSAHWLDDRLVLGAPGCFEGSGGLYMYDTADPVIDPSTTDPYKDPEYEDSLPYIGYSTTICDLNGDGISEVISGGPRGKLYRGQVVIYQSEQELAQVVAQEMPFELVGEQMGSYYGASILCQDMNGDGVDDLVVSAPWYTVYSSRGQSKPDTGRVYFYPGNMTDEGYGEFLPLDYDLSVLQQISGVDEAETFGFSLSSAGDVNYDGAYDMWVGSPNYNDGEGKVSLFLGGFDGIEATPAQVILPSKLGILDNLRGFGWSIAGGKDMDNNDISDVLIGAYTSQHAVLLRSLPIIDVEATIGGHGEEDLTELDPLREENIVVPGGRKVQGIHLQACFKYVGAMGFEAKEDAVVTVNFEIKLDSASESFSQARLYTNFTNPTQVYKGQIDVDLAFDVTKCTAAIPVYYRGAIGYSSRPVLFSMEAGLEERESFADRAVLNQQLIHDAEFELAIASDCPKESGMSICTTSMAIEVGNPQYVNMDNIPLAIGIVKEFTLPVKVQNRGPNSAYGSKLEVFSIPSILPFLPSDECNSTYSDESEDDELYTIQCSLPGKMVFGDNIVVSLDFNLTKLQSPRQFDISFLVTVLDPSVLASDSSGVASFNLNFVNLADIKIDGGSRPVKVNFNNNYGAANKVLGYEGPVIRHRYDITMPDDSVNYAVKNITLSIYWPEKFPGGAWLFPLEVVTFPNQNETEAMVFCDHEDMIVTNWGLMREVFSEPEEIYTNFSCKENRDLCSKITCKLDFLERGGAPFKISLGTRLQEYFLNDFGSLNVTSYAEIESVEEQMTLSLEYSSVSATSYLAPSLSRSRNYLWIIIGASVAALIILIILILILWKCNFFKRQGRKFQPEPEPPTVVGYLTNAYDGEVLIAGK